MCTSTLDQDMVVNWQHATRQPVRLLIMPDCSIGPQQANLQLRKIQGHMLRVAMLTHSTRIIYNRGREGQRASLSVGHRRLKRATSL